MSEAFDPLSVAQDLSEIDVSDPMIFKHDAFRPIFARLRQEAPVHYCKESPFGPYWSITRFHDIMAVDKNHHDFSSQGGVSIGNRSADFEAPNFISMDPPKHDLQRKAVTGVVAPMNLAKLEPVIRERAGWILDDLPTASPLIGLTRCRLSSRLRCSPQYLIFHSRSVTSSQLGRILRHPVWQPVARCQMRTGARA